jgi:hypothetical protein
MKKKVQNEPSVGAGACSIQPTLVLPRYQHARIEIHQNVGKMKNEIQNEPSIGAGASIIQPALEPPHYRGLQY